jgi:hypothetical protein
LHGELFSAPPERPLSVHEPSIKNDHEGRSAPLRLIGSNFIEVIGVTKEKGQKRQDQGRRGKDRHGTRREPQPPLATRELPQLGLVLQRTEGARAFQGRRFWRTRTKAEHGLHLALRTQNNSRRDMRIGQSRKSTGPLNYKTGRKDRGDALGEYRPAWVSKFCVLEWPTEGS